MRELKLIYVINEICKYVNPGKKAMQKLIYFLQEKGFQLGYNYGIHHYGPFCSSVENDIQKLEMDGVVVREQYRNSLIIKPSQYLNLYLNDAGEIPLSSKERGALDFVLTSLCNMTPMELELLSTVHFIVKELIEKEGTANHIKVVQTVENIKGDKFSESEIEDAVKKLLDFNFIEKKRN
ncbi:hypothetical protein P378_01220 [Desulforamulus profundi]|uniref:Uncharacterized protein n=1 Tax=Desulforamulus profundi TaxID=1383067 RepID=A0A2C6MHT2_9FIRM|nr:Panacea domain-containing protein [Desulforamulus profundi]PHJ39848.1 hypothetical protein P378_01220 [Desulforamulus profundi]